MIRIRKRGELWEVEDCSSCGDISRNFCDLERVRQIIIDKAADMDYYARWALEIINNQSDIYSYQGGKLISKKPLKKVFCLTLFLEDAYKLEIIIPLLESGVWKVRKWKTPDFLLNYYETSFIKNPVKKHYMIIETTDPDLIPIYNRITTISSKGEMV